jgi:hypothetical protein
MLGLLGGLRVKRYIITLLLGLTSSVGAAPAPISPAERALAERALHVWMVPLIASYFPDSAKISEQSRHAAAVTETADLNAKSYRQILANMTDMALPAHEPIDIGHDYGSMRFWVLETLRTEGIKAYISGKGQNLLTLDSLSPNEAYRANFIRRDDVEPTFYELRDLWQGFHDGEISTDKVRATLLSMQAPEQRLTVLGSFMAKIIETHRGKEGLAKAARLSGEDFYQTYAATRPGAMLLCPIPPFPKHDRHQRIYRPDFANVIN